MTEAVFYVLAVCAVVAAVAPGLRGLDTGCVHHGRGREGALTAWVPSGAVRAPFDIPDANFWQIPARRPYYASRENTS